MIVRRSDADEPSGIEVAHLLQSGSASFSEHPWLIGKKRKWELQEELEDALSRKRPVGFGAWPEEVA